MSLIVEDGTARTDSQSYISVADADSYLEAHEQASAWAAKSTTDKEKLLIRATRALDALLAFAGYKVLAGQALQWPRQRVPGSPTSYILPGYYPASIVPPEIQKATAETAILCISTTIGAQWDGAGLKKIGLGQGALEVEFDPTSRPAPLPPMITSLLRPFTSGGSQAKGSVPVRRA